MNFRKIEYQNESKTENSDFIID